VRRREFSQNKDDMYSRGFYCEGLYRYSRHPNYFGEIGQWLVIYLLTVVGVGFNWSIIGLLNLFHIFFRSIMLTESLSDFKYPPYKRYASKTSILFPWFPKRKSQ